MKTYFKAVVIMLWLWSSNFILLPYLISLPNDYAVALGGLVIIVNLPLGWFAGRWLAKDFF